MTRLIQRVLDAPERIRTSDLRFRRPTASTATLALASQISPPESPNNRQKFDAAAVSHGRRCAVAPHALPAREREHTRDAEADDVRVVPSGRVPRTVGDVRIR